ncbi:hypothetical protein CCB80_04090 [Armatimonadetes bacterium Uphvl-Ar1]|nr:hypothetical protein CCB80_04090 [Armatimonadetes bacterium Uphvl-Ar1]
MAMKNHNWTFCDGDGRLDRPQPQFSRRQILTASASLIAGGVWWAGSKTALGQAYIRSDRSNGPIFVSLFLRGGADGLNIVAPYGEDDYYRLRPSLAIAQPKSNKPERQRLTDLDGFFGVNPALLPLFPDYAEGNLAFVHAVGSYDTTHSHFQAMSTMELGLKNEVGRVNGGWLARHLNSTSERQAPLRAVAFSSTMPDSLSGANGALAINHLSEYRLQNDSKNWHQDLTALYDRGDNEIAAAGRDTLRVLKLLNEQDPRSYQPSSGANYPNTQLGQAFRETAFLIKQDVGLEVACLDSVGWDSHITQGNTEGWLYELLKDVADSIAAFRTDLKSDMNRIVICVQTEFGRRVAENSGLGTDHGAGGCMILLGEPVNGGKVYGDWPTLVPDSLTGPGDLQVTTDYRNILADISTTHLKNMQTEELFPGLTHQTQKIL